MVINYKGMVTQIALTLSLLLMQANVQAQEACENAAADSLKRVVYDFSLVDPSGTVVPLSIYQGKVLLIVNTATGCGFTPQYKELEAMYQRMRGEGLEILDIPCNQFGEQAPGSDEEIGAFCQLHFDTEFPRFKKSDVNGDHELALYTWLKNEQGFRGFDMNTKIGQAMANMLKRIDPNWETSPDIKWNFTKFLINRQGEVVARFEPMVDMAEVEGHIQAELMRGLSTSSH